MDTLLLLLKFIIVGLALAQLHEITIASKERAKIKRKKLASLKQEFEILDQLEIRATENIQYDSDALYLMEEADAETSDMIYKLKRSMAYLAEVQDHDLNNLGLKNNADNLRDSIN